MKKPSEQTIVKVLVNLKCLGKMGRCARSLGAAGREYVLDELTRRGWIDERCNVLPAAQAVVLGNLSLCEA